MKVSFILFLIISLIGPLALGNEIQNCNAELALVQASSSLQISNEKELIQKLFFEYPVLAPGVLFDEALIEVMQQNRIQVNSNYVDMERVEKLSNQSKKTLSAEIFNSILKTYKNLFTPSLWPTEIPQNGSQVEKDVLIDDKSAYYGFANRDEFEMSAAILKAVDDNPGMKKTVIAFISRNLSRYLNDFSQRGAITIGKNNLSSLTEGSKASDGGYDIFATSFWSLALGGFSGWIAAANSFHGLLIGGTVFSLPWIVVSMAALLDKSTYKKLTQNYKPLDPHLESDEKLLPPTQLPSLLKESKILSTSIKEHQEQTEAFDPLKLKEFEPKIDVTSLGSLTHFGMEIEHGIHMVATEVAEYLSNAESDTKRTELLEALKEVNERESFVQFNKSVSIKILNFENHIKNQMITSQELQKHIRIFEELLNRHIKYLDETIATYNGGKDDAISKALQEKHHELSKFQDILSSMNPVIYTYQDTLNRTRQNLVDIMRQMTFELAQSQKDKKATTSESYKLLLRALGT